MIEILRGRRSVRKFTGEPLDVKQVDLLKESLVRSPTSKNNRPWEFVVVTQKKKLADLSFAKPHGAALIRGAAIAFVIVGDENKSDVWVEDCSIAAISLQYTAEHLGLGSCWVQIRKRDNDKEGMTSESYVQNMLGIPPQYRVANIVAIGHPAGKSAGVPYEELDFSRFHQETF